MQEAARFAAFTAILLVGCGDKVAVRRDRDLSQCIVASTNGHELTACLALQRNWRGDSADLAGRQFQAAIDSARLAGEARAAHLMDSLDRAERDSFAAASAAERQRRTRLQIPADSAYVACLDRAKLLVDTVGFLLDYARWEPAMRRCRIQRERAVR